VTDVGGVKNNWEAEIDGGPVEVAYVVISTCHSSAWPATNYKRIEGA
jgi:hypothetical protein